MFSQKIKLIIITINILQINSSCSSICTQTLRNTEIISRQIDTNYKTISNLKIEIDEILNLLISPPPPNPPSPPPQAPLPPYIYSPPIQPILENPPLFSPLIPPPVNLLNYKLFNIPTSISLLRFNNIKEILLNILLVSIIIVTVILAICMTICNHLSLFHVF